MVFMRWWMEFVYLNTFFHSVYFSCSPFLSPSRLLIFREKMQLNEDIATKQEQVRQRHGEINTLQAELEESTRQRDELERQKSEAQSQLENLDNEVSLSFFLSSPPSLSLSPSLFLFASLSSLTLPLSLTFICVCLASLYN